MPKLNRQGLGLTAMRTARVILGASLLLSILSVNVPTALVASGPMCTLSCCAGRAPHAAGSCMNGSCHAVLSGHTRKIHIHRKAPIEQAEQLCGLSRLRVNTGRMSLLQTITVDFNSGTYSNDLSGASKGAPAQQSVSTTALTKPCQPDCGSCASGSASTNRQRNTAALAYANRARPPSSEGFGKADYGLTKSLSALCGRGATRGPPTFFS